MLCLCQLAKTSQRINPLAIHDNRNILFLWRAKAHNLVLMSIHHIHIHLVFATKKRNPLLTKSIRPAVIHHIRENCVKQKIDIDFINGYYDHLHCLFNLSSTMSLAEAVQHIKGESSHWINQTGLMDAHFEWQSQYYAVSVSPSAIERVRSYIKNQEHHHQNKQFEKEIEDMGFTLIEE